MKTLLPLEKMICREAGKPFATKSELAELRKAQADFARVLADLNAHGIEGAKRAWQDHGAKVQAAILAGNFAGIESYARGDFERRFAETQGHLKMALSAITNSVAATAQAVAQRFADAAHEQAAGVEQTERAPFDRYGMDYAPSAVIRALREAAAAAVARTAGASNPFARFAPKDMLPFLDL